MWDVVSTEAILALASTLMLLFYTGVFLTHQSHTTLAIRWCHIFAPSVTPITSGAPCDAKH